MNAKRAVEVLRTFAQKGCQGQSPLYEQQPRMAEDERIIKIVQSAPDTQPAPNLILAVPSIFYYLVEFSMSWRRTILRLPNPPDSRICL